MKEVKKREEEIFAHSRCYRCKKKKKKKKKKSEFKGCVWSFNGSKKTRTELVRD
ncbi:hypothetical protein WH47_10988 [Habropoda laboriosa]|uniref:Uncharacterized protein n=1 Tax=Habropoda laboriosa TaxID=597456 RepID=A0A0L7QLZ7_9HYME|nr:hypothetical protein WH47_10988 [Habropoda laboriosa]